MRSRLPGPKSQKGSGVGHVRQPQHRHVTVQVVARSSGNGNGAGPSPYGNSPSNTPRFGGPSTPPPSYGGTTNGAPTGFNLPFPFGPATPEPSLLTIQQGAFKASGKTVVVTGGSQGIGRATALLFAQKGYNVVVAARDEQKLQYVAQDCANAAGRQGSSLAVRTDVTDERDVRNLVNQVLAKFESVDAVINNAGVFVNGAFSDTPVEEAKRLMDVNYIGPYMVMQSFLPILLGQAKRRSGTGDRPSIINVLSFAGKVPLKNMSAFTASKFALAGLSQAVRAEVEGQGVHVGIVSPGFVKTNAMSHSEFYGQDSVDDRRLFRQMMRALPLTQSTQEVGVYGGMVTLRTFP